MGQLYSKLNSLVMNDVDTASDPDRPRQKLETEFTSPARLLPDPRSPTNLIDRTPIVAPSSGSDSSNDTPKTAKPTPRPRYLETDLDNALCLKPMSERVSRLRAEITTSTPVQRKTLTPATDARQVVDSIIEQSMEQILFSDTGHCEVVTTERSEQPPCCIFDEEALPFCKVAQSPSFTEEIIIEADDVEDISSISSESVQNNDSMAANWSGIGGPDRSLGSVGELSSPAIPDSSRQVLFEFDDSRPQSDSLVVHSDSQSLVDASAGGLEWDSYLDGVPKDDGSNVDSLVYKELPDVELLMKKNSLNTPQKTTSKNGAPRTPLADVSKNSPLIPTNKSTPAPLKLNGKFDGKIWRNVRDERVKLGMNTENTPPHSGFSSYPPDVVQSAPGKIRTKPNKPNTRWSNDSLVI